MLIKERENVKQRLKNGQVQIKDVILLVHNMTGFFFSFMIL